MSNEADEKEVTDAEIVEETLPAVREPTPGELINRGLERGASPESIEKLVALYERLKAGVARDAFVVALSDFQSRCPIIKKTLAVHTSAAKGGKLRYRYAPLDHIVKQVRSILHDCCLSYSIDATYEDGLMRATCKVTHELGHSESSTFMAPVDKDAYMTEPQKYASALTYAKRYAFCNALGILTGDEDDDARSVGDAPEEKTGPAEEPRRDLGKLEPGEFTDSLPEREPKPQPPKTDTYNAARAEYLRLQGKYVEQICQGDETRAKGDYGDFKEQAGVARDKTKLSLTELRAVSALVKQILEPDEPLKETVPCESCGDRINTDSYQVKYSMERHGRVLCGSCTQSAY